MRRLAVGLGLVLVLALASIALAHTLVILNPGNNYTDELEPGGFPIPSYQSAYPELAR